MSVLLIASLAILATAILGSVAIMLRTGETRVALLTGLFLLLGLQQGVALSESWGISLAFDLPTAGALAGLGVGVLGLLSVFALGRTLDELERAEALHWESMEGVRGLTELASRREMTLQERLPFLLELGCERLALEIGLVSRVRGGRYEVLAIHAPESFPIGPGAAFELADTFCSATLASDRPLSAQRADEVHWLASPARNPFHFEAYLGCAIRVSGEERGTLVFASIEPREERFTASHKDLLVLMGQWIGAEQERSELAAAELEQSELAEAELERRSRVEQELEHSRNQVAEQERERSRDAAEQERERERERSRRDATEQPGKLAAAVRRARRRLTGREPRSLDLNASVARLEKRMRRLLPSNVELVVRRGEDLAHVQAPNLPLDAIVMSLLRKAGEALPEGGQVTVATANHEAGGGAPDVMQAVAPARYVTLTVSESSGTVDAEALSHVFDTSDAEPAPGAEAQGGLPLATVYRLLQRVGGDLSVEIEPGSGSRFVLFLPLPADETRTAGAPVEPIAPAAAHSEQDTTAAAAAPGEQEVTPSAARSEIVAATSASGH